MPVISPVLSRMPLAERWPWHGAPVARATIDIDINIFVDDDSASTVFDAFPEGVKTRTADRKIACSDGQVRVWWDKTPINVFLNTHEFHAEAAEGTRWERFMGERVPFLSCYDLAVFKVFFNRTRDLADLEEMQAAGTLDIARISSQIIHMLGANDARISKLTALSD